MHAPPLHVSPVVQALPSLHVSVLFVNVHPTDGSQTSVVHALLSLQVIAVPPPHAPALHRSPVVQAFPSLHVRVLFTNTHPVDGLQVLSVHGFMSSQTRGVVPMHAPELHASPVVHAFPSSHVAVLFVKTHPVAGLHESFVHGFPSVHPSVPLPPQVPAEQVSPIVHASPSSHDRLLLTLTQPEAPQESSVHGLPSSHPAGTQEPAQQVSSLAQRRVRTHVPDEPPTQVAVSQGPAVQVVGVHVGYWQPDVGSHVPPGSAVHSVSSGTLVQAPAPQMSTVHATPSSHGAVFGTLAHPDVASHASSVHGLPSSHASIDPGTHAPPEQRSSTVQTLPSSHDAALSTEMQPAEGLHALVVQTLPSSQLTGAPPRHTPAAQVSPVVQALPSSQLAVFSTWTHPSVASQESSVQGLPSSQPIGAHAPPQQI